MFNKKEIGILALASLVIGFLLSFKELTEYSIEVLKIYLKNTGYALITVFLSMAAAKIAAHRYGCGVEFRLWNIERYGFHHASYSKKLFPAWIFIPLGFIFLSLGYIKWLALMVFDVEHITRELKGKRYSKISEGELAVIAFCSILASIALAVFSKFMGWNDLATLNMWFAFFNIIPFSELSGMKILQGSIMLWIFSAVIISVIVILIHILNPITTLMSALIFGIAVVITWFNFFERK